MAVVKLSGAALIEALEAVNFSDRDALAVTVLFEAGGEAIEGRIAVACAVRNRVVADLGNDGRPDWWGEGYRGVCWRKGARTEYGQFSCWWPSGGALNHQKLAAFALEVAAGRVPAGQAAAWAECQWIAAGVISGAVRDRVAGCTHYHTRDVRPAWSRGVAPAVVMGRHLFYKGV